MRLEVFYERLDDYWRRSLFTNGDDPDDLQRSYGALIDGIQSDIAGLPAAEQDAIFQRLIDRNADYLALGRLSRHALSVRLGVSEAHST